MKEEWRKPLDDERREWKSWLKTQHSKTKIVEPGQITSWQIDGEAMETMTDFIFLGFRIAADGDCSQEIKWCLFLGIKAMTKLDSIFKKQTHHFANKGPYTQSYGFSSSHIWIWGLDQEEFKSVNPWCSVTQFTQSCLTLYDPAWTAALQVSLSFAISQSLFKLMSIELMMPSTHLILCHPLILLLSIFPSIRVFSSESALHIRWTEYWSFSFSISPSNKYSGLISFRVEWFGLIAVQGTLRIFSSTTVRKLHFFSIQPSSWSNSHICTWLLEKP